MTTPQQQQQQQQPSTDNVAPLVKGSTSAASIATNSATNTTATVTTADGSNSNEATTKTNNEKKQKNPSSSFVIPPPRPQLSKAERRALQEQQRAAKAAATAAITTGSGKGNSNSNTTTKKLTTGNTTTAAAQTKMNSKSSTPSSESNPPGTMSSASRNDNSSASTNMTTSVEDLTKTISTSTKLNNVSFVSHLSPYKDPNVSFDTGPVLRPIASSLSSSTVAATAATDPKQRQQPASTSTSVSATVTTTTTTATLHPAIVSLGYQYSTGSIRGGNARCRAMIQCYCIVLQDLLEANTIANSTATTTPTTTRTDWKTMIENTILKPAFTYWTEHCRTHSVSMGNAFTFIKTLLNKVAITTTTTNTKDTTALQTIVTTFIDSTEAYIRERIDFAKTAIAETACNKLLFQRTNSSINRTKMVQPPRMEVLLTYGHSEAIVTVLTHVIHKTIGSMASQQIVEPNEATNSVRIIIVDSKPLLEGRILLQKLQREVEIANERCRSCTSVNGVMNKNYGRIEFTYIHIQTITYVLPTVSKVLLGAASLQSDGSVMGRVGTAMIAYAAHLKNIPVLICTETHKISNRGSIPLESLTQNELFHQNSNDDTTIPNVKRIDVLYDLTPASYVSGIVTELGIVPPSSVAVLLREMNQ